MASSESAHPGKDDRLPASPVELAGRCALAPIHFDLSVSHGFCLFVCLALDHTSALCQLDTGPRPHSTSPTAVARTAWPCTDTTHRAPCHDCSASPPTSSLLSSPPLALAGCCHLASARAITPCCFLVPAWRLLVSGVRGGERREIKGHHDPGGARPGA